MVPSVDPAEAHVLASALLAMIREPLENAVTDNRPQTRVFVEVRISNEVPAHGL